jgi:RNA polymerase sigma-70 factor (ECF subfamily)
MLRYQEGDASAMDELLARYRNPVYRFAFRLSRNSSEAEDIAQEVFLRVHQFRARYTPSGRFSTWIFSIAHNLFISRLRKLRWQVLWPRQKDDPDELADFPSLQPSVQDEVSQDEISRLVQESIQGLPFLQKEVLVLREYEKLDYEEISKILHKSLGTVKTLIHRARNNLKTKLLPYVSEVKEAKYE